MTVKICGITRLEDAYLALEFGADALGFVFEPTSPRCVARRLDLVGSIGRLALVAETVAVYGRYDGQAEGCQIVQSIACGVESERRRWQVLRLGSPDPLPPISDQAEMLVLDAFAPDQLGGSGKTVDWELAAQIVAHSKVPVILAGGLTPDNVSAAIAAVKPSGVDVSSGVESGGGGKDPIKLRDFIQAAKGTAA